MSTIKKICFTIYFTVFVTDVITVGRERQESSLPVHFRYLQGSELWTLGMMRKEVRCCLRNVPEYKTDLQSD